MKNLRIPDWDAVSEQAVEILSRRSKDLRVTAWLIEALVRTRGVAGLHFGLQLLRELCQTYWDQIHERPDASGVAMTVAPIAKLGRRMCLQAIRSMPILASSSYGKLSVRDYRASQALERVTDAEERQRQIDDGVLPLAEFDAAAAAAAAEEWESVRAMFEATSTEVDQLNRWLNDRCGSEAPSLGGVASAIQECLDVIDQLAPVPTAAASGSDGRGQAGGRDCPVRLRRDHHPPGSVRNSAPRGPVFPRHRAPVAALLATRASRAFGPAGLSRAPGGGRAGWRSAGRTGP